MNLADKIALYITCVVFLLYGFISTTSITRIAAHVIEDTNAFAECSEFLMPNGDNIWFDAKEVNGEVYCTSIYNGSSYSVSISELKSTVEDNIEQQSHQ